MTSFCARSLQRGLLVCGLLAALVAAGYAGNEVLGEIQLEGTTKVEKTSGVWVDRQYVGYLKELKGSKKIMLLPGEHEIAVRQAGYKDFEQKVLVRPGEKQVIRVAMEKDLRMPLPTVTAEIKLSVIPDRAAVFVDGLFAGHVAEFSGVGRALLVAPGKRKLTISLPGYRLSRRRSRWWPIKSSKSKQSYSRVVLLSQALPPAQQP